MKNTDIVKEWFKVLSALQKFSDLPHNAIKILYFTAILLQYL